MRRQHAPSFHRRQEGAALIVVLVMLLVMTLLGLASLRGTIMEERMSASVKDRALSFQAVEYALREGEAALAAQAVYKQFPASGCTAATGFCATPVPTSTSVDRWMDPAFTGWKQVGNASSFASAGTARPEYFIEYMGLAPGWPFCDRLRPRNPQCMKPRFRITARSVQAGRATVYGQTTYATP